MDVIAATQDGFVDDLMDIKETTDGLVADMDAVGTFMHYVYVDPATNAIRFIGANLYVQSGSGYTDDGYELNSEGWEAYGLGNLIVGYDETAGADEKTGSHNIVVGRDHSYTSYGGLVAGYNNSVLGQYSSIPGGHSNQALARTASVSGGRYNVAADYYSWVGGGYENTVAGWYASAVGGAFNQSSGECGMLVGGDTLSDTTDLCDVVP